MAVKPWRWRNPTKRRWCTGHGDAQSPTCVRNRVNPNAIGERTVALAYRMRGKARDRDSAAVREFLSELSTRELVEAHAGGPGSADLPLGNQVLDGYVVPENLLSAFEHGRYAKVPILIGANARETGLTSPLLPPLYDGMPDYRQLSEVSYGRRALGDVLRTARDRELYTKANFFGSLFWRTAHTDEFSRRLARHQPVYAYLFDWGDERSRPGDIGFIYGAAHATEIAFFHGTVSERSSNPILKWAVYNGMTDANRAGRLALSDAMVSYMAQFVRTGTPNAEGSMLPWWQPWSNSDGEGKYLLLGADQETAVIGMRNDENSMKGVWDLLNKEPLEDRAHIAKVVYAVQGFYVEP